MLYARSSLPARYLAAGGRFCGVMVVTIGLSFLDFTLAFTLGALCY